MAILILKERRGQGKERSKPGSIKTSKCMTSIGEERQSTFIQHAPNFVSPTKKVIHEIVRIIVTLYFLSLFFLSFILYSIEYRCCLKTVKRC